MGSTPRQHSQPIFVVSGGAGASGELLVRTLLAQFPNVHVPVKLWRHVHEVDEVQEIVAEAVATHATVVHTLVKEETRHLLVRETEAAQIPAFDLIGSLLDHLAHELHEPPLGQPGRYRTLHTSYFDRIEAIEFTVNHDDGKRIADLPQAEIVLLGVSRVGKTPLSIYLSIQGWKVANVPVVPGIALPAELAEVPDARIVGLIIEPHQLLIHRRYRQTHLGIGEGSYSDRASVVEEVRAANHLFYARGYPVIDVTGKSIETTSEEVLSTVTRRLSR
jgi:regulator of PEP synthase PpsR (kinase-PPPase family)